MLRYRALSLRVVKANEQEKLEHDEHALVAACHLVIAWLAL